MSERIVRIRPATGGASTTLPHVAPGADPAFQQALDKLLLQVDTDNVLAVGHAFQKYADDLRSELVRTRKDAQLGLCGMDPVSLDAVKPSSFGGKIDQLLDVHWKHWEELAAVVDRLRETALSYGHTEAEISHTFPPDQ